MAQRFHSVMAEKVPHPPARFSRVVRRGLAVLRSLYVGGAFVGVPVAVLMSATLLFKILNGSLSTEWATILVWGFCGFVLIRGVVGVRRLARVGMVQIESALLAIGALLGFILPYPDL